MNESDDTVLVKSEGGVRTITLHRPEVLNAFNADLLTALGEAVRCVLLTGAGRAFCSGQDLAEYADRLDSDEPIKLEPRFPGQDCHHGCAGRQPKPSRRSRMNTTTVFLAALVLAGALVRVKATEGYDAD